MDTSEVSHVCVHAESAGSYITSREAVGKSDRQALRSAGAWMCVCTCANLARVKTHIIHVFRNQPVCVCSKVVPITRANTEPITAKQTANLAQHMHFKTLYLSLSSQHTPSL